MNKAHLQRVTRRSLVPLHFQSWPQSLYSSPLDFICPFRRSQSLLMSHHCSASCVARSLLVLCFCSKDVITRVSFYVDLLHESNLSWTSVSMIYILCLISSFCFGARVGWCGMHQCPPSYGLAPSTSAHSLGPRLETYIVPWGMQSLMAGCSSLSIVGLHYCPLIDRFCK